MSITIGKWPSRAALSRISLKSLFISRSGNCGE